MPAKPGPKPKISKDQNAQIAALIRARVPDAQIADQFSVSRQTINRLKHHLAATPSATQDPLEAMIALEDVRRAKRDEIYTAFNQGRDVSALWDEYLALP